VKIFPSTNYDGNIVTLKENTNNIIQGQIVSSNVNPNVSVSTPESSISETVKPIVYEKQEKVFRGFIVINNQYINNIDISTRGSDNSNLVIPPMTRTVFKASKAPYHEGD